MRKAISTFSTFFMCVVCLVLVWPNAAQTQHSVTLNWTASATTGVDYNVYRGTVTGGPYTLLTRVALTTTTYADTTGVAGTKYFYVVTAICTAACPAGLSGESGFSNEVSATFLGVPATPAGLSGVAN